MARKASDITKAIRKICIDSNFKITHAEARPLLAKLGFKIAKEPGEKSENYKKWEAKRKGHYPKDSEEKTKAFYLKFIKVAGLPTNALESIMEEDAVHRAFCNERNYFDVTKHNWQRVVGYSISRKPKVTERRLTKGGKFLGTKIRSGAARNKDDVLEIIKELISVGGAKEIEKRLVELDAERTKLNGILAKARSIRGLLPTNAA